MKTKTNTTADAFFADSHDHSRCVATALDEAQEVCAGRGVRFTRLRRRVLEIVWRSHKPLGAYAILDILSRDGRAAAPPTVYRALDFLLEQGLVHRIASLNAFVGCSRPGHDGAGQFLICRECGEAAELDDQAIRLAIRRSAADHGFHALRQTIEVTGVCPNCRNDRLKRVVS